MTPEQKLMHLVLLKHERLNKDYYAPEDVNADNIARYYSEADEADGGYALQDARSEVRCGEVETNITSPWSRNYESKSVAARYVDGSWVGWTYWYGGGKHGEPEAVEWMDSAYDLTCVEEQVMTTKRTFTVVPAST